jgi:transcription-repair coupling factor (superfamily II helicase)
VSGAYPESCEYYAPYIHDRFVTLIDYIPQNALVLFDEWDSLSHSLQAQEDKLNQSFKEGLDTGRLLPIPRALHLSVAD